MGPESFSPRKETKRENVGLSGRVDHFDTVADSSDVSRAGEAVLHSDQAPHAKLVKTLNTLLSYTGVQPEWIADLEESEKDEMNRIVGEYLAAEKKDAQTKIAIQQKFEKLFIV